MIAKKKDEKVFQVKMKRNLFAPILHMGEILKYPLTPVPLSLCYFDGSPRSTAKKSLGVGSPYVDGCLLPPSLLRVSQGPLEDWHHSEEIMPTQCIQD